ncbi:MAG: Eco57I restriction-modification methylase domain-containing protein [Deltaproteobacteria bacterium]|nr:Eco57I restriction-modification methylase domain-containing protein [Deltaproteobacteria bacterium]
MPMHQAQPSSSEFLCRVDVARKEATTRLIPTERGQKGQFFTPQNVASLMASMFEVPPKDIRLLDPGAGIGSLTAAFVEKVLRHRSKPSSISVTAYEVDGALLDELSNTLLLCRNACEEHGVSFSSKVIHADFIEEAVMCVEPSLFQKAGPVTATYNCSIMNPPYKKIRSSSDTRKQLRRVQVETSNLYTAFVALALSLMEPDGELVAITPRSFCNGPYFLPFRKILMEKASFSQIHVFESRKKAFSDDAVLQENVIYRVVKGRKFKSVILSSSLGPEDLPTIKKIPYSKVVRPDDKEMFIRLTLSQQDEHATLKMASLRSSLKDLDIQVSTGRVVDFRAREHLRDDPLENTVPLIYPCHFSDGYVTWPIIEARKPNAIVAREETKKLMVPEGVYVLTKRFTSKEERRRVVAAIYDPARVTRGDVGFENHLNYFHRNGQGLPPDVAIGLWCYLNSTLVDQYFRQFSGHTQVNATDLRSLGYPTLNQLKSIARGIGDQPFKQQAFDDVVEMVISDSQLFH